jgi:hypothetical protein
MSSMMMPPREKVLRPGKQGKKRHCSHGYLRRFQCSQASATCVPCTGHPGGHCRWTSASISHSQSAARIDTARVVQPAHRVRGYVVKTYRMIGGTTARCSHTPWTSLACDWHLPLTSSYDRHPATHGNLTAPSRRVSLSYRSVSIAIRFVSAALNNCSRNSEKSFASWR